MDRVHRTHHRRLIFLFASLPVLKIKHLNGEEASNFVFHSEQLEPQMACRDNEFYKFFNLGPDCENVYGFSVQVNYTAFYS